MSRGAVLGSAKWVGDPDRQVYEATIRGTDYVVRPAPAPDGWDLVRVIDGEERVTEHASRAKAMAAAMMEADRPCP